MKPSRLTQDQPPDPTGNCTSVELPEDLTQGFLFQSSTCANTVFDSLFVVLIPKCSACPETQRKYVLQCEITDFSAKIEQGVKTHKSLCGERNYAGIVTGDVSFKVLADDLLSNSNLRSLIFQPTTQFVELTSSVPFVRETSTIVTGQRLPAFDIYLAPNPESFANTTLIPDCQLIGITEITLTPDDPLYFGLSFKVTKQVQFLRVRV